MCFAINLQFPGIFVTGKETFIHTRNVQDQTNSKEGTCLKKIFEQLLPFEKLVEGWKQ